MRAGTGICQIARSSSMKMMQALFLGLHETVAHPSAPAPTEEFDEFEPEMMKKGELGLTATPWRRRSACAGRPTSSTPLGMRHRRRDCNARVFEKVQRISASSALAHPTAHIGEGTRDLLPVHVDRAWNFGKHQRPLGSRRHRRRRKNWQHQCMKISAAPPQPQQRGEEVAALRRSARISNALLLQALGQIHVEDRVVASTRGFPPGALLTRSESGPACMKARLTSPSFT